MSIKHAFESAKEDGADETLVRPSNWNADHVGSDFFDRFREFIPWVCLDGFNTSISGGSISVLTPHVQFASGSSTGNYAYLRTKHSWRNLIDTGKLLSVEFLVNYLGDTTTQTTYFHITSSSSLPSETAHHFGFKLAGGSGQDIYASNGDGTNSNVADTGANIPTGYQRTRLRVVLNPGTDCKFYVNDVLKRTHTTNLPTQTYLLMSVGVITGEDSSKTLWLGRLLIEKEHA